MTATRTNLIHWGGPPYPSCECGHDRLAHTGMHGTDNTATRPEVMAGQRLHGIREFGCNHTTPYGGWCHCARFTPRGEVGA